MAGDTAMAGEKREPERDSVTDRVSGEFKRAKDNISQSAASARADVADNLQKLSEDVAQLRDTVSDLAKSVATEVGQAAGGIGGEVASSAKAQANSLLSQLEDTARKNPIGTIAGALCIGLFIGLMQGRR